MQYFIMLISLATFTGCMTTGELIAECARSHMCENHATHCGEKDFDVCMVNERLKLEERNITSINPNAYDACKADLIQAQQCLRDWPDSCKAAFLSK